MTWLKTSWTAISAGFLFLLATFAAVSAAKRKAEALKWKETATAEKEKNVQDSIAKANQALTQAKMHNAKAGEAKKKAQEKLDAIGKKDPELAAVVSGWKSSRLRNSTD